MGANCSVADCPNKVCLHLSSNKCWPHTVGAPLGWTRGLTSRQRSYQRSKYLKAYYKRISI